MATSIGWASLQIIPTVSGVAQQVQGQIVGPLGQAGQQAGQAAGDGIAQGLKRAEAQVKSATQNQVKAIAAVEDQSNKVRVAELKLQELRDSGKAKASQIEAAEGRLVTERRKLNTASGNAEAAEVQLTQARERAEDAARDLEDAADDLAAAQGNAGDASADAADQMDGAGGSAIDLAKNLAGVAVAAAGIGSAWELAMTSMDNELMLDKMAASMGASPALAAEYGAAAGELYNQGLGESLEDVTGAIQAVQGGFLTLGFEGEVSMDKAAERALNFANVMGVEVNESVQAASQLVVNGLAADSTEAFDLMTASFQRVPAAMREELPEIMNEYGKDFAALGFTGQESFGMLVNAAENGKITLDKTGDALKEFVIKATDLGDTGAQDAMKGLGLDAEKTANQLLAGGDVAKEAFDNIVGGLSKITDPAKQAEQAVALFGSPLEDLGKDKIPGFLESMTGAEDAMVGFAGATDEMGATANDNAATALESLKRSVQGGLIDGLESAAGWIQENSDLLIPFGIVVGGMAVGFTAYTVATKAWTVATELATIAQTLLDGSFKASGIGLVVTLVAGLVAGIIYLATQTQFFQKTWEIVWGAIKTAFSAVWNFIKNNWSTILMVLTGPIGIAVGLIVKNWDKISAAFQAVWDFVKNITGIFVDWVIAAWDGFIGFFTGIPGRISSVATTMWDAVKTAVTGAKDWVVSKWDEMIGFVTGLPGKIASATSGMWDGIKNAFRDALNWLIQKWNNFSLGFDFKIPVINKEISFRVNTPDIPLLAGGGIAGRTDSGQLYGPGTGTSDSILGVNEWGMATALVSDGEGIVKKSAMDAGGAAIVAGLNGYATGGVVGREPYGLPMGTAGEVNVPWVDDLEAEFGLKASTYAGHQEKDGQNKGIDWVGSVGQMQSFADFLAGIGDQLEQVIWANPETGQKVGIADGVPVGPGTDQPGYYRNDWSDHMNHVHTRQSYAFGKALPLPDPELTSTSVTYGETGATAAPSTSSTSSSPAGPPEPEKVFSARDRLKKFGSDAGAIAVDGMIDIFGVGEYLDLADRYTIPEWDGTKTQSAADMAANGVQYDTPSAEVPAVPAVIPESVEVARYGAELYAYEIARVAKDMGLGEKGALIGEATALVEAGNPLKMWANSKLPESLNLPHDAVGNNGTSTGLFQQQDFPEWGALEQRMNPAESARMFYEHFPAGWESMDPGAVAQGVQRSSLPHRYAQEMGAAQALLDTTGLFDTGGWLMPGQLGFNGLEEPEAILKDAHWKIADANIAKVDELVGAGVGGGGPRMVTNNHVTIADQAAWQRDQAQRDNIARLRYGGKP